MAKTDAFLKIDGVDAESTDDKFKGWIEVESWSWGATNSGTASASSGQVAGKVVPQDFHFTKKLDKSSPVLFQHVKQKPDGSLGGEVRQKYDYAANKKI